MSAITKQQIKILHTLKSKLGIEEDAYRAMIMDVHGFSDTSKDLSEPEATMLIDKLATQAKAKGVWTDPGVRTSKRKYDELGNRPGMASPAQLRMIEAMWAEVSTKRDAEARGAALEWFVFRICKVQKVIWLKSADVYKIVSAIKRMGATKHER